MSWTQGVQPREELDEAYAKKLDAIGAKKFGTDEFKFNMFVWDDCEPGVLHLDFQNDKGDYRSLKLTYGDGPVTGKTPSEL